MKTVKFKEPCITIEAESKELLVLQDKGYWFQCDRGWGWLTPWGHLVRVIPPESEWNKPQTQDEESRKLTDKDLEGLQWYVKGMQPAPEGSPFSFTFAKDQDGELHENVKQPYHDITKFGKIRIGRYEYKVGGKDKNLISRSVAKEG